MDSLTPAMRAREEAGDEDDDEDYMPGPDVKKRLFDGDSETPLRTVIKQPVLVYLRVRPKSAQELKEQDFFQVVEDNVVLTTSIRDSSRERFVFSNVFQPTASQKDVFNKTVVPILQDFFDGQNCLLFTYGITNSGKTHTIMGTAADPGVLPRALDVIFNSIEKGRMCELSMKPKYFSEVRTLSSSDQAKEQEAKEKLMAQAKQVRSHQPEGNSSVVMDDDTSNTSKVSLVSNCSDVTGELFGLEGYQIHETTSMEVPNSETSYFSIWISFVEIYNEIISDLLAGGATVKLKEDKHKNFFIDGTREVRVDSVEEALLLLKLGLKHRHVAGTKLNYQSSRSHSIYTIKCIRTVNDKPSHAMVNRISIIDLAGTERSAKTGAKGQRVKEAGKINQSLMVLGRCITAMRHNQSGRAGEEQLIPYRESRLTQLFQNYLVGKGKAVKQGKISMIINVSNNASVYDETMNVLRFSALTSKVVPIAKPEQRVCGKSSEVGAENTLVPRPSEEGTEEHTLVPRPSEEGTEEHTEDMTDERREVGTATVMGATKCTCAVDLDAYKSLIQQLQVELIEQEDKIRAEVCQEFHQQLTEIEENHSKEMEDQQFELTSLYEGRIKKLNETTKKMKGQKRRRPNDDDEDAEQTSREEENIRALKKEMELERCKAVSELKDLTETYESNIVCLNEQVNTMSLKLLNSERIYEGVKQQCEDLRLENEEYKRTYDELRQKYMCLTEGHPEVTVLQDLERQCKALKLEAQDFKTQCEAVSLELQGSKRQCEALKLEAQDFKMQCEAVSLELQGSKKWCEELKEQVRSKEEQMSQGLMAHQCELQATAERLAAEMAGQKEDCQREEDLLQGRISELMKEIEELQEGKKSRGSLVCVSEMLKVGQEVEGLEDKKASQSKLVAEVESLLDEKNRLSAEVEGLESEKASQSKLVAEIESLLGEKNRLSAEVEGLEDKKASQSKLVAEVESLLNEKNRLSAEVEGLEDKKASKSKLVAEIESLLDEKNRLSAEVEGLEAGKESKMAGLKEQLLVCTSERSVLQSDLLQERMERIKMQAEKDARIREAAEIRILIGQRTEEISSLRAQMEDLESKNAELSGGLKESFSSTFEEMNGTLQRQRDRIAELTTDIEKYKSENEELTENSIDLQMQIQRATTSRDSYASQLEELTKEYEGLKRSTSQRESKLLDTIDQTNSMMDEQVADLKKRCATRDHELAVSKETNCELQLCVRKKDEDLLEAQKQLSRLQVEFLETSQAQATRIEELTSSRGACEDERDAVREELKKEREKHQAELQSIQGNHQLETARLLIHVRELEDAKKTERELEDAKKTEVLRELEVSEAKKARADKKTKALLTSTQKEVKDLREQVGSLKSSLELNEHEQAGLKAQKDELLSELAEMKEKMESQMASLHHDRDRALQELDCALQERDHVFHEGKVGYDAELRKMRELLKAEVTEKEWLKAELQKMHDKLEAKEQQLKDTPSQLGTLKAESCSHDDLDSSKPRFPLLENSQLLESFVDPVKEERVEMVLELTPVPTKRGRGGRKRKASSPVKPVDILPQEGSPVKKPRSCRRKLPTTALQQQDENVEMEIKPAAAASQSTTYSKIKEQLSDLLLPSKPARSTRRTKLLKSQISGPLEVVHDVVGSTPIANKGKFVLGRELRAPRASRGAIL